MQLTTLQCNWRCNSDRSLVRMGRHKARFCLEAARASNDQYNLTLIYRLVRRIINSNINIASKA